MRKFTLLLIVGLVLAAAGPALGSIFLNNPQPGNSVSFQDGNVGHHEVYYYPGLSAGWGGPFTGTLTQGATHQTWSTFCVEAGAGDEWISFGKTYNVLDINSTTAWASGNVVTDVAKLIYYQYGNELVNPDLNDVQAAIWHGVTHDGSPLVLYKNSNFTIDAYDAGAQALYDSAYAALYTGSAQSKAEAKAKADTIWVLNPVYYGYSGGNPLPPQNQSVLYQGGTYNVPEVPEPATIVIWSLLGAGSWLGMRVYRRRRGPVGRKAWSPENRQAIHDIIARGATR